MPAQKDGGEDDELDLIVFGDQSDLEPPLLAVRQYLPFLTLQKSFQPLESP